MSTRDSRGFTMIELLVVIAIIGILAGMATVNARPVMEHVRMSRMRYDLAVMRDLIDQYRVDKRIYPVSLADLVEGRYLRQIPTDVITRSASSWQEIPCECGIAATTDSSDGGGMSWLAEDDAEVEMIAGICDVRSGAEGVDRDGIEWGTY